MERFIKFVLEKKIRLVVFDFDQTMIQIHTGGGVAADRIENLRTQLAPAALNLLQVLPSYGIQVAIASFAHGPTRIRSEDKNKIWGEDMIKKVLEPWVKQIRVEAYSASSKVRHLTAIGKPLGLHPHDIMLIDDAASNISRARENGYWTLWVKEAQGLDWKSASYDKTHK
jgi:FMN phosphatase YigB (HAD superfamily)